jgi:hypothetical protein
MLAWAPGTGATTSAAHPFNLEINGTDWINSADMAGIRIEMPGPGSNGSMTFTLQDPTSIINVSEWDEVRFIEHAATRPILFGGFVQSVSYTAWAANGRTLTIQCVGYGILLDKKVFRWLDPARTNWQWDLVNYLVSFVNLYGGRITASHGSGFPAFADATNGVAYLTLTWFSGAMGTAATLWAPDDGQTLRGVIEQFLGKAVFWNGDPPFADGITEWPAPGSYWVDSYARLRLYPDLPPQAGGVIAGSGFDALLHAQYDEGTVPGVQVDFAGTLHVEQITYEREDTDRVTSAFVIGGAPAGTDYYRKPGLERTGDLELIVSDSGSLIAGDVASIGGAAVGQTTAATARGQVMIFSLTPFDIWPGRNMQVTAASLGLSASQDWRITSTEITFESSTARHYVAGFGGNIPAPSAMRRTGRFQRRLPGQ